MEGWVFSNFRDRVVHDTDTSDCLADRLAHFGVFSLEDVAWVANDSLALGDFFTALYSADLSFVIEEYLIDILVEHESTSVDGAHSGETFWDTTKTVDGVYEWGVSVSTMRVHVELDFVNSFNGRFLDERVIGV